MLAKQITKSEIEKIVNQLPDQVDIEDFIYRIYLLQKIQSGEADIQDGKVLQHDEALKRLSSKWQN